jgi:hypothetical protein
MSRLFTFGCSVTNDHHWPTWADIVSREFEYYKNWGQGGAGNSFIFYSLVECIKREQITSQDTVIIMWTNIGREDRYIKNQRWITPGNIYTQTTYDQTFVEKFADPTGYLIKDMANISAAKHMLESIGCKFYFLSVVPLAVYDDHFGAIFSIDNKIIKLYKEEIDFIKPSIYSVVFNNNWYSRTGFVDEKELKREYNVVAGPDWPTWENFINNNYQGVPKSIKKEIESHNFSLRLTVRTDTHPLPSEHLLYLDKVLPEVVITDNTKLLVQQTTAAILAHQKITKWWNPRRRHPGRF